MTAATIQRNSFRKTPLKMRISSRLKLKWEKRLSDQKPYVASKKNWRSKKSMTGVLRRKTPGQSRKLPNRLRKFSQIARRLIWTSVPTMSTVCHQKILLCASPQALTRVPPEISSPRWTDLTNTEPSFTPHQVTLPLRPAAATAITTHTKGLTAAHSATILVIAKVATRVMAPTAPNTWPLTGKLLEASKQPLKLIPMVTVPIWSHLATARAAVALASH